MPSFILDRTLAYFLTTSKTHDLSTCRTCPADSCFEMIFVSRKVGLEVSCFSRAEAGPSPVAQRSPLVSSYTLSRILDKIALLTRGMCNVGIESSARLFRQLRILHEMASLLPSGDPLSHSALLSIRRESLPLES
jgi:hypothetical protein